jgi:hypothetical protein
MLRGIFCSATTVVRAWPHGAVQRAYLDRESERKRQTRARLQKRAEEGDEAAVEILNRVHHSSFFMWFMQRL